MNNRRGILLIEMVAVVGLLAVFMVVISGLFAASIRERDSVRTDELVRRVDLAIDVLRRDLWGAGAIATRGNQLILTTGQDQTVWNFQADGTIVRTARQPQRQEWKGLPAAGVSLRGPLVALTFAGGEPQKIVFVSQLLLAEGRP